MPPQAKPPTPHKTPLPSGNSMPYIPKWVVPPPWFAYKKTKNKNKTKNRTPYLNHHQATYPHTTPPWLRIQYKYPTHYAIKNHKKRRKNKENMIPKTSHWHVPPTCWHQPTPQIPMSNRETRHKHRTRNNQTKKSHSHRKHNQILMNLHQTDTIRMQPGSKLSDCIPQGWITRNDPHWIRLCLSDRHIIVGTRRDLNQFCHLNEISSPGLGFN